MHSMIPQTQADLDGWARQAVKEGRLKSLKDVIHILPACHPKLGLTATYHYEGEVLRLSCRECGKFTVDIKISRE